MVLCILSPLHSTINTHQSNYKDRAKGHFFTPQYPNLFSLGKAIILKPLDCLPSGCVIDFCNKSGNACISNPQHLQKLETMHDHHLSVFQSDLQGSGTFLHSLPDLFFLNNLSQVRIYSIHVVISSVSLLMDLTPVPSDKHTDLTQKLKVISRECLTHPYLSCISPMLAMELTS